MLENRLGGLDDQLDGLDDELLLNHFQSLKLEDQYFDQDKGELVLDMGLELDLDKELGDNLLSEMLFNDNQSEETKNDQSMMRKEAEMLKNNLQSEIKKMAHNINLDYQKQQQLEEEKEEERRDFSDDFDDLCSIEDLDDTDEHVPQQESLFNDLSMRTGGANASI